MKRYGMTLVEIMIIVAILGILIFLAVPNFITSTNRVKRDTCINNLRQINLAKEQWSLENNIETGTPTATDLDTYIKDGTTSLVCPSDPNKSFTTSYNIDALGTDPTCKIDADHHL